MEDTKDAIFEAAKLPMSIIIIGIGNTYEFESMRVLDGDNEPITNKQGVKISRDIVQFVCYDDYKNDPNALASQVLAEVPRQVETYYHLYKNFKM
jgi:hypothetical protein